MLFPTPITHTRARGRARAREHTHTHTHFTILPREDLVSVRVRRVGDTVVAPVPPSGWEPQYGDVGSPARLLWELLLHAPGEGRGEARKPLPALEEPN